MLYLITAEAKEGVAGMEPEQFSATLENLVIPSLERLGKLADERSVTGGVMAGRQGLALVIDAPSNEDVARLLSSLPFAPLHKWNVVPLASFHTAVEAARESAGRMKVLKAS
jgi:hypothetical protein